MTFDAVLDAAARFGIAYLPYLAVPAALFIAARRRKMRQREFLFLVFFSGLAALVALLGAVFAEQFAWGALPATAFAMLFFDGVGGSVLFAAALANGFALFRAGDITGGGLIGGLVLGGAACGIVFLLLQRERKTLILKKI